MSTNTYGKNEPYFKSSSLNIYPKDPGEREHRGHKQSEEQNSHIKAETGEWKGE